MSTLVSDIILQAFMDLKVLPPGGSVSTAVQNDAFLRLKQMYASWSTEQASVNTVYHQTFTVTAGTSTYTVGTGGTLVATKDPVRITGWTSVSGNFRNGGKPVSFDDFAASVKDPLGQQAVLASVLAADNAYPSKNIRIFPVPAATPGSLILDYWAELTAFAAVSDALALAPGYEDALHWNLAVELYPQYGRQGGLDPVLAANAQNSKAAIVALNRSILGQNAAPPAPAQ